MVSKVKEIRENLGIQQQELAELVGVSRQMIYYLERGQKNPSLTISFKISEILKKPLEELFSMEPVIYILIGKKTLDELEYISKETGIELAKLTKFRNINEQEIEKNFTIAQLERLAELLNLKLHDLFEE